MTLDALGNIGDFIGGLGVVATLAYLAIQIRHNTRGLDQNNLLLRLSFESEFRHDLLEFRLTIASDEQLSDLWSRGLAGLDRLDAAERARFELLAHNVWAMMAGQFDARQRGLDELTRTPYLRLLVSNPGIQEAWVSHVDAIVQREAELGLGMPNAEFVAYMDSLMPADEAR